MLTKVELSHTFTQLRSESMNAYRVKVEPPLTNPGYGPESRPSVNFTQRRHRKIVQVSLFEFPIKDGQLEQ